VLLPLGWRRSGEAASREIGHFLPVAEQISLCGFLTVGVRSFPFLIYQHIALPSAGLLVGAMNTAYPTAWALLTFEKFLYGSPDPPCTRLFLLCIFNPTNKLVSSDRRQVLPAISYFSCLSQGFE
jgi:hypothetical protein